MIVMIIVTTTHDPPSNLNFPHKMVRQPTHSLENRRLP